MKRIAFVIGAAKYTNLNRLDCCSTDAYAITTLLEKSGRDYEIQTLIDPTAAEIKDSVRDKLSSEGQVAEVFFYFSGHGINGDNDLVLCPVDFASGHENRTGFSRSFLLDALRDAGVPQVAIVIDACESGRTLIKRQSRPAEERQPLERFIQFSSSLDDQYSLAGDRLSAYTKVFVEACLSKRNGPIYYSDIEEYIRDTFSGNSDQTPFFIRQGTSLEKFAEDAALIQEIAPSIRANFFVEVKNSIVPAEVSRTERLAKVSAGRASQELVQGFLDKTSSGVMALLNKDPEIEGSFESVLQRRDDYLQKGIKEIVSTLEGIKRPDNFVFAKKEMQYGTLSSSLTVSVTTNALANLPSNVSYTYYLKRNVDVSGIECSFEFKPKFNALSMLSARLLFVPSLSFIATFYRIETFKMTDWDKFVAVGDTSEWRYERTDYGSSDAVVKEVGTFFADYIRAYIDSVLDGK